MILLWILAKWQESCLNRAKFIYHNFVELLYILVLEIRKKHKNVAEFGFSHTIFSKHGGKTLPGILLYCPVLVGM